MVFATYKSAAEDAQQEMSDRPNATLFRRPTPFTRHIADLLEQNGPHTDC